MTTTLSITAASWREQFADMDAGDVRRDRIELAADLPRGVRLRIPHVDVGRPSRQVDVDDRLVGAASRLRGQDVRLPLAPRAAIPPMVVEAARESGRRKTMRAA